MSDLFKPCPFCGNRPSIGEYFGKLAAECRDSSCTMKPSTWLTAGSVYDVRKLAKHWNQRPATKKQA